MTTRTPRALARAAVAAAAAATALLLPLTGTVHAAEARAALPPGVVALQDGEPCPPATLCLYRDYGNRGPAYGIGAGYNVNLNHLPMPGSGGASAADNVSSWVNNTGSVALLVDGGRPSRPLFPGQQAQEPPEYNDTVDLVAWPS